MNALLGRILLLTIRQTISLPYDEFVAIWERHDLPVRMIAKKRTPEDAFRRAAPKGESHQGLKLIDYNGGHHVDEGKLERFLVYSQDSRASVDMHHLNRAVVYLEQDEVKVKALTPLLENEQRYLEGIARAYALLRANIDGSVVRAAIARALHEAHALCYRDGSYLIPQSRLLIADAIGGVISELQPFTSEPKNVCWDIPYIETATTRRQVEEALLQHVRESVTSTLLELQGLPQPEGAGRARSRRATLLQRFDDLNRSVDNYEALLATKLPAARWEIQMGRKQAQR